MNGVIGIFIGKLFLLKESFFGAGGPYFKVELSKARVSSLPAETITPPVLNGEDIHN